MPNHPQDTPSVASDIMQKRQQLITDLGVVLADHLLRQNRKKRKENSPAESHLDTHVPAKESQGF